MTVAGTPLLATFAENSDGNSVVPEAIFGTAKRDSSRDTLAHSRTLHRAEVSYGGLASGGGSRSILRPHKCPILKLTQRRQFWHKCSN